MKGKLVYIGLFVGLVIFVIVVYILLSSDILGGIIDSGAIKSTLGGLRDTIVGETLGKTFSPAI